MVSSRGEWVYTIVENLTLHCISMSTENLEQAVQVSGRGALCGMGAHAHVHVRIMYTFVHAHMQKCTEEIIFLCCPSL